MTNVDDDVAGIFLFVDEPIEVSENGGTEDFSLSLSARPSLDAAVLFSVSDPLVVELDTLQLDFTPDDWDTPQTVRVTGLNDGTNDGDPPFVITAEISSLDPAFQDSQRTPIFGVTQAEILFKSGFEQ
ncbi:MAG: hypothetical protein AAGA23_23140 [Pseudomonadota bacterium]